MRDPADALRRLVRQLLVACLLMLSAGGAVHAGVAAELFTPFPYAAAPLSAEDVARVAALRALPSTAALELVTLNPAALGATAAITLPDGTPVVATRQATSDGQFAASSWIGAWDDGRAVFFVRDGEITGTIRSGAERYAVTPLGGGVHVIRQLIEPQPSSVADDAVPIPGSDDRPLAEAVTSGPAASTLAQVDVLVAYTSAAKAAYGGDISSLIASQFVLANDMFATSNAGVVLSLVGIVETPYDENAADGSQADWLRVLEALKAGTDPALATIHTKRDELQADLVMLVHDKAHVSWCGAAYYGTVNGQMSADWAFGEVTVADNCMSDGTTFTHELGHMFGATHDPKNSTAPPYESYGYGYQYPYGANPFRSIMAYPCTAPDPACPLDFLFSNPDLTYNGVPAGVANANDVARLIRLTGQQVAVFRGPPFSAIAPIPTALDPLTLVGMILLAAAGFGLRRARSG